MKPPHPEKYYFIPNCRATYITSSIAFLRFSNLFHAKRGTDRHTYYIECKYIALVVAVAKRVRIMDHILPGILYILPYGRDATQTRRAWEPLKQILNRDRVHDFRQQTEGRAKHKCHYCDRHTYISLTKQS